MSIAPINVARVTQNLRSFNLLSTIRSTQLGLFRSQNQIATGLRFQRPSEDPVGATMATKLDRRLDILDQVRSNLDRANAVLSESESAMQSAVELVREAHTTALSAVGDGMSAEERDALRSAVEGLLDQLVTVGNREYLDTFLFSGHFGESAPFERVADGVLFRGDDGRLETILDSDLSQDEFTISGLEFFNAASNAVEGVVDLNPQVTLDTRLSDLLGPAGNDVNVGILTVATNVETVQVDLSSADTVGDVIDMLNANLPEEFQASLVNNAIRITSSGSSFTITDSAGGTTASDLGIFSPDPSAAVFGDDLDAAVTLRTRVGDLFDGAGADLSDGIRITNGQRSAVVDFAGAETIEDLLNRINLADVGVAAQIRDDGKTLEVRNRISGADLTIGENGGDLATVLGIRSMHPDTRLADLNDGLGVHTVDGDDLRIQTADGTQIDIDLDTLDLATATLGDLIDLINTTAGGAAAASLASTGNGIVITDNTAGTGALKIERLNLSQAIDDLGLTGVSSAGNQIIGGDVNPVRVDSPFTGLLELSEALAGDDTQNISRAAERLKRTLEQMQRVQGRTGALARGMLDREDRVDSETTATRVLQSDVRDVDLAEAIVRFQQLQTALQANLTTASRTLDLTLLDFLR
jgi:flagellar hook-associated protein 3 FlgL